MIIVSALTVVCPLWGCGAGGGSASVSTVVQSAGSDVTQMQSAGTGGSSSGGCSKASFTPNYSTLIPLYRWSGFPLKVYFKNSGVITTADGQQTDLQATALSGFNQWDAATGGNIKIQVTTDPNAANVIVHFSAINAVPTTHDILGLEKSTLYSDNTVKSADIMLTTWPGMTSANVASFRETATHEFGHALGLNGHSDNSNDVMYASHSLDYEKPLTSRDVNTMLSDYCGQFSRGAAPPAARQTRTVINE